MPNIKEVPMQALQLAPTDRGIDADTQAARRLGAFASQQAQDDRQQGQDILRVSEGRQHVISSFADTAKAGVDFLDHEQISKGMADEANLRLSLTQSWDETLKHADPNDPAVGAKFRDGLQDKLQDWADSFYTEKSQNWAQDKAGALLNHFYDKTVADQSTLAMVAARDNLRTMANTNSATAALDPSSTPTILASIDHNLDHYTASSPTLTAEHAAQIKDELGEKMREQVVRSAITSAINKNPDAGLKMAQDPQYAKYVDGAEVNSWYTQAKRNDKLDADMGRTRARQELEDRSTANLTSVIKNLYDPDQADKVTAKQIAQIPDNQMRPSDREHAIKLIDAELKPEAESKASAVVSDNMLTGIRNGHVTMDDIYKAKEDGTITRSDFSFLQTQYSTYSDQGGNSLAKKRTDFIGTFRHVIDSSNEFTGSTDEAGKRHLWDFEQELSRREEALRHEGDPHSLYDPKSPNYMGSPEALAPYKKTQAEEFDAISRGNSTSPSPAAAPSASAPRNVSRADVGKLSGDVKTFFGTDGKEYNNPKYKP